MPKKSRRELTLELQAKKLEEEKLLKERIVENNKNVEDLELAPGYEGTIILIALLEQSVDENPYHISPLEESERLLAPGREASLKKLQAVVSCLGFVEDTCKSGSIVDGSLHWNGFKERYYVVSVFDNPKKALVERAKECSFEVGDATMILMDVKEFLIDECLQFLKSTREDYGLPHKVGDKSKLLFTELLWEWSPGQIFNFIWRAAKEAVALMTRERLTKDHASNVIIGAVERMVRKAKQDRWNVPPFSRHKNDKQSWMSYVYFNLIYELKGSGVEYTLQDLVLHARIDLKLEDGGPDSWLLEGASVAILKKYSMSVPEVQVEEAKESLLLCPLEQPKSL